MQRRIMMTDFLDMANTSVILGTDYADFTVFAVDSTGLKRLVSHL